jgi:hypothetical protein
MKKMIKKILILTILLFGSCFITFADPPGPPGPGGDPGTGGGIPVGAPIDTGVIVLLILGVFYAAWKFYSARKEKMKAKLIS